MSLGREYWYGLHLTTDHRYTLREMQPSADNRDTQYPDWWVRGSGKPYPTGHPRNSVICASLNPEKPEVASVVIVRDREHPLNISGGKEVFIPERFLHGLVPQALLDAYRFWKDESRAPRGFDPSSPPSMGHKRLLGLVTTLI